MPATPTRENLLEDVYAAMVALEQPYFQNIDANFHAYDYMPIATPTSPLKYPFTFRVSMKGGPTDRHMGNGPDPFIKDTDTEVWVFYLVGLSSQPFGALSRQADKAIRPFQELYIAHRSISGTVRNLMLGTWEQGDWEFNSITHYGVRWPVTISQQQHMVSST